MESSQPVDNILERDRVLPVQDSLQRLDTCFVQSSFVGIQSILSACATGRNELLVDVYCFVNLHFQAATSCIDAGWKYDQARRSTIR